MTTPGARSSPAPHPRHVRLSGGRGRASGVPRDAVAGRRDGWGAVERISAGVPRGGAAEEDAVRQPRLPAVAAEQDHRDPVEGAREGPEEEREEEKFQPQEGADHRQKLEISLADAVLAPILGYAAGRLPEEVTGVDREGDGEAETTAEHRVDDRTRRRVRAQGAPEQADGDPRQRDGVGQDL